MSDDIRIGVFVCDCGSNIAGTVDVPAVTEYSRGLDHVVVADEGRWSCSVDYLARLGELIKENQLNRVVIASCTPRTHEPLFKASVREAGLNPYLLEFVSIREQVSWVHMDAPEAATAKAKDLVAMGVAKAALLEEGQEIRLPVKTDCLVIGGGPSGMHAALNIADQGMRVVLVERERRLGGLLNRLSTVHHGKQLRDAESIADSLRSRVESHELIYVHLESTVDFVEGYIGNYTVKIRSNGASKETSQALDISTIVVATGMTEIDPTAYYDVDGDERILSLLQLEQRVREGQTADMGDVVIINCVGSRNDERGCCSVGCLSSVKNALELKRSSPERSVHVLYRDLCLTVEEQQFVEAAKAAGVQFLRFKDECYPVLDRGDERLRIEVEDLLLGESLELGADHVVLTLGLCGDNSVDQVKGLLKVSANPEGFFQEAHIKLGPLDFPSDGISLCGCAKNPKR
ncbi:MAG: CoB--CoM heterodisulfide reductase iron-sulfur subunit A family protein, partial [Planctomycetota bacterium]